MSRKISVRELGVDLGAEREYWQRTLKCGNRISMYACGPTTYCPSRSEGRYTCW